jgi:hypothetical protein
MPSVNGSHTHGWRWWTLHHHLSCELTSQFLLKDPLSRCCNKPDVHVTFIFFLLYVSVWEVPVEISLSLYSSSRCQNRVPKSSGRRIFSSKVAKDQCEIIQDPSSRKIIKILTTHWGSIMSSLCLWGRQLSLLIIMPKLRPSRWVSE